MRSPKIRFLMASLICFSLWLSCPAGAQDIDRSFDISMDPRTVALGEGGAALSGSTDAFAVNPATLASRSGIWVEYTRRGMEWVDALGIESVGHRSFAGGIGTPAGTFAFAYRRYDQGEFTVQTPDNPQGYASVKVYDHTFGVAWAHPLTSWIQAGAAAKIFTPVLGGTAGSSGMEFTPAYLLDIGIQASSGNLLGGGRSNDKFSMGIALQNFGSNLLIRQSVAGPAGTKQEYKTSEQEPRTLRLGIAYQIGLMSPEPGGCSPLRATLTGDYWTVLNFWSTQNKPYLAYGLELTAYELLSVRLGGYIQPFQSVYGRKDVAAMRYGVGLELPFTRFAQDAVPLTISASYTAIPLYSGVDFFGGAPATANVFSLTLKYQ